MIKIKDIYQIITKNPIVVVENENIRNIILKVNQANPVFSCIYVVDDQNMLKGVISLTELLKVIAVRKGYRTEKEMSVPMLFKYTGRDLVAKDIMKEPLFMKLEDRLEDAVSNLIRSDTDGIAIVNDHMELIGDVNIHEVLCNITFIE